MANTVPGAWPFVLTFRVTVRPPPAVHLSWAPSAPVTSQPLSLRSLRISFVPTTAVIGSPLLRTNGAGWSGWRSALTATARSAYPGHEPTASRRRSKPVGSTARVVSPARKRRLLRRYCRYP
jgi:hypothetical protein